MADEKVTPTYLDLEGLKHYNEKVIGAVDTKDTVVKNTSKLYKEVDEENKKIKIYQGVDADTGKPAAGATAVFEISTADDIYVSSAEIADRSGSYTTGGTKELVLTMEGLPAEEDANKIKVVVGSAIEANVATVAIGTKDEVTTALPTVGQVKTYVAGLQGAMHFVGVITRNEGETDTQAITRVITSPKSGDVVVMADNTKEYIYVDPDPETSGDEVWREIGAEGLYVQKTRKIAGITLENDITVDALNTALGTSTTAMIYKGILTELPTTGKIGETYKVDNILYTCTTASVAGDTPVAAVYTEIAKDLSAISNGEIDKLFEEETA